MIALRDHPVAVEDQIADRRGFEQIDVAVARLFEFDLAQAQRLVLHFELVTVNAELVLQLFARGRLLRQRRRWAKPFSASSRRLPRLAVVLRIGFILEISIEGGSCGSRTASATFGSAARARCRAGD